MTSTFASGLALEPPARLDPVQIAVNIELQEDRRMIRGSPCRLRIDPAEIERTEIKRVDKHVNHTNRVVLIDPIIQAFGKQRRLPAIHPLDEALHRDLPPENRVTSISCGAFSHSLDPKPTFHESRNMNSSQLSSHARPTPINISMLIMRCPFDSNGD